MACAGSETTGQYNFSAMRERMVETQIRARDVQSAAVLDAMRRVPRHLFVPDDLKPFAYDDRPLPIGHDQTISQPYIVAYMTDALQLEPAHTVLEIGTGSGYQATILADIARQVYSIEIVPDLADERQTRDRGSGLHERRGAHRERVSGMARSRALRSRHRHRRASGDPGGAGRPTCGRRCDGRTGRDGKSGNRRHHEDACRHRSEAHDRGQVRAHGVQAKGTMTPIGRE